MIRYVLHALRAHWRAGRTLVVLTVLGVALGVASVLSIQILNGSALAAFRGGLQAIGVQGHSHGAHQSHYGPTRQYRLAHGGFDAVPHSAGVGD